MNVNAIPLSRLVKLSPSSPERPAALGLNICVRKNLTLAFLEAGFQQALRRYRRSTIDRINPVKGGQEWTQCPIHRGLDLTG